MTTQTNSQKKAYLNLHTEGMAYLNNIETVTPNKQGAKSFLSLSVALLEGDPEKPTKTYVSLVIPEALDDVTALLVKHREAIADRDTKVFANIKFANLRHKPFVYGENSQRAGELGVNLNAKLIGLKYLKVGDQVVYNSNENDDQRATDTATHETTAVRTTAPQSSPAPSVTQSTQSESSTKASPNNLFSELETVGADLFTMPLQITLSKDDPQFAARKEGVKAAGYHWNSEKFTWMLPEVELSQDDPAFESKKSLLKKMDYRFNRDSKTWRVAFSQRGNRQRQG
ncbi:hypothetical protein AB835_08125 [Candidatus Endobugula sertula]|uniref:DUF3577 domain-containing protein n=1 Tax=Candidatus Endobugula sertula TaxID=62101 RepID=A0A1D2QPU8_9GAMM|nr:hypothetical protein AB835_08125 [Candidatus Endobugula sertula]